MKIAYVVLYVKDEVASLKFWKEKVGMVEKGSKEAGTFNIVRVGFPDQEFSFELVPLELMKSNPDGLDLATPSIAFYVPNLEEARAQLLTNGAKVTEPADHSGTYAFAFQDNEDRWFAVLQS